MSLAKAKACLTQSTETPLKSLGGILSCLCPWVTDNCLLDISHLNPKSRMELAKE